MMTHKPDRRLMKDTLFCFGGYVTVLKAGEICEYFAHSDTFLFPVRDMGSLRVVPYYPAAFVETHPDWFEVVF